MRRKLRTRLGLSLHKEKDIIDNKTAVVYDKVQKSQKKGTYYHDRTAKMQKFEVRDQVWACNYRKMGPKIVIVKIRRKI